MSDDWIAALACVLMWGHGFLTAWAFAHKDSPFWRGYLDVATFRVLWRRA